MSPVHRDIAYSALTRCKNNKTGKNLILILPEVRTDYIRHEQVMNSDENNKFMRSAAMTVKHSGEVGVQ